MIDPYINNIIDILIIGKKSAEENNDYLSNKIRSYYEQKGIFNLCFEKSENGKPFIKNRNDVFFNISHTKSKTIVAFYNENIGVDIEEEKEINKKIVEKFYSVNEKKEIENAGELKKRKFVEIWTRKEALCKYSGEGLTVQNLSKDTVTLDGVEIKTLFIDKSIISFCIKKQKNKLLKIHILK